MSCGGKQAQCRMPNIATATSRNSWARCGIWPPASGRPNVLQHMVGYFSKQLDSDSRQELQALVQDYRAGLVPLVVPAYAHPPLRPQIRCHVSARAVYLDPHPDELMLRNHVIAELASPAVRPCWSRMQSTPHWLTQYFTSVHSGLCCLIDACLATWSLSRRPHEECEVLVEQRRNSQTRLSWEICWIRNDKRHLLPESKRPQCTAPVTARVVHVLELSVDPKNAIDVYCASQIQCSCGFAPPTAQGRPRLRTTKNARHYG